MWSECVGDSSTSIMGSGGKECCPHLIVIHLLHLGAKSLVDTHTFLAWESHTVAQCRWHSECAFMTESSPRVRASAGDEVIFSWVGCSRMFWYTREYVNEELRTFCLDDM